MDKKRPRKFWEDDGCQCPKMDNKERWGYTEDFFMNASCPVHGDKEYSEISKHKPAYAYKSHS